MTRWSNRLLLQVALSTVFLLSGCTVGPDYVEPEIDWEDQWDTALLEQVGTGKEQADWDLEFWWLMFDDPVLNRLIEIAVEENLSLRIAGLKVLESQASLGVARGYRYPQVQQLTGDAAYLGSLPDGGDYVDDTTWSTDLNVGWEIDFWGRFKRGIEAADAAFFASVANQQDFQVLLKAQVANLYFAYRTALLRLQIARNNAEIQKRSFDITTQLYESGDSSELDLQQAKTQYMATLSAIPGLELNRHQLRNALCALLSRPPGGLPELDEETLDLPVVDPDVVKEVPAQLLLRRPDIRSAAALVAAQTAQVGVAEAAKYPHISLFGTVGLSESTLSLGVGPALTWDIFNYGRIKNNVRVQDARLQQAIENFQIVALGAAQEIDDSAISVVKSREQKDPQHQSSVAAKRSLELANARYKEGYAGFQRVIEAQRALAAQNDRELSNDSNHISAIISFYKALGGGWSEMTIEQLIPEETRATMEERTNWGDLLWNPHVATPDSPSTADQDESSE